MNAEALRSWLDAVVAALPHGSRQKAAATLGLSPSGLSKLLAKQGRGFHEPTCRCAAWILNSKSEKFPVEEFPILREHAANGIVVETRQAPGGSEFITWRKQE